MHTNETPVSMTQTRSKTNKKFMVLSAIGIFMVVDQHTFTAFNILGDFIPYNSFFMPMFVFISGYFNKVDVTTNIGTYFHKKLRTLLLPYFGIATAVLGIQWLIDLIKTGEVPVYPGYLGFMLENIITIGTPYPMVIPMWFVTALFAVLMIYALIKKFLSRIRLWNSYVMLAIFTCAHLYAVYLVHNMEQLVSPGETNYYLMPLKVLFFLPFLELGVIYREHLEGKHTALPGGAKLGLMFGLLIFNMVRTIYLPAPYDVAFDSIDDLSGFTSPYIITPLVSSLVGILFWLTFVELVGKPVYESKFVNYMSCNTFWIMGFQLAFFNILNLILMLISEYIVELPYFDVEYFRGSEWYFWEISNNIKVLYVVVGVLGPLAFKWIFEKISAPVKKSFSNLPEKFKRVLSIVWYVIVGILVVCLSVVFIRSKIDTAEPETWEDGYQPVIDNGQDEKTDDIMLSDPDSIPAYALVDLIYGQDEEVQDYYTEFEPVYRDGTYTVTIRRSDDSELQEAFNGLSCMAIKLLGQLGDDMADIDISNTEINDISVICDGVSLIVIDDGTVSLDDAVRCIYFDCYETEDKTETYDFKNANEIVISFTLSGIAE